MSSLKKWILKVTASSAAVLALLVASSTVGSTCWFVAYQPDLPEALREKE